MTRVHAFTVSFPPRRFIGSELMTGQMLEALAAAGHPVSVRVGDGNGNWIWHGLPVSGSALRDPYDADVVIVHAGLSWPGVEHRYRHGSSLVMICHNVSEATHDDVAGARPDLVVVNSRSMAEDLGVAALVIHPPAEREYLPAVGRRVTSLSLNEMKGGRQFWGVVRLLPDVDFLAIKGGYGKQIVVGDAPNVTVHAHVPHDRLDEVVWADTGVFLQLSEAESWGMAAAEAIAHGIPVIAHPTPGIVENLGDAAVYIDRDDVAAIANMVRDILAAPWPHVNRALARAAEQRATSTTQLAAWVAAIEGLGDAQHQRDRAAEGLLGRSR